MACAFLQSMFLLSSVALTYLNNKLRAPTMTRSGLINNLKVTKNEFQNTSIFTINDLGYSTR
jgi:hypothetical protein